MSLFLAGLVLSVAAGVNAGELSPPEIVDSYVHSLPSSLPPALNWSTALESEFCAGLLETARVVVPTTTQNLRDDDERFTCAQLTIPFDYSDPNAGTGNLTLLRFRPNENVNSSVFINPGGPGVLGSIYLAANFELFENLTASAYDIIGWEPRGTETSQPSGIRCFPNAYEEAINANLTAIQIPFKPNGTELTDEEYEAVLQDLEFKRENTPDTCEENSSEEDFKFAPYLGPYYNALDLDYMRRVVGDAKLNYHGVSYGTVFALFYVSMFPDTVGRFVMDAVDNEQFSATHQIYEQIGPQTTDSVEEELDEFYRLCASVGAEKCALASLLSNTTDSTNSSWEYLRATVDTALEQLYSTPLRASPDKFNETDSSSSLYIRISDVETFIRIPLYVPAVSNAFSDLGTYLYLFVTGDADAMYEFAHEAANSLSGLEEYPASSVNAVLTGRDGVAPSPVGGVSAEDVANEIRDVGIPTAPRFVASAQEYFTFYDQYDLPKAKTTWYKFGIPKGHEVKDRILIIGNRLDPVTPLRNARAITELLGPDNAHLLVHGGIGHTSFAQPSWTCTIAKVASYFRDGDSTLPDEEDLCDEGLLELFGPPSGIDYL